MAKGAAKFASAVFACAVLAAPLAKAQDATEATTSDKPAATDDCLLAPNGEAPQGQHWFYRTERGTQRHCWYLRDKPERVSQPAPGSIPATKPPARTTDAAPFRPAGAPAARASADARAELPGGARGRFENDALVAPRLPTAPAVTGRPPATMAADDDVRGTQGTAGLSRPLDTFSAPPPSAESSAADDGGANAAAVSPSMPTTDAVAGAEPAPSKTSLKMLLMVIFGALAFAGVTASLTHRLARVWRKRTARLRRHRMWKPANIVRSRSAPVATTDDAVLSQQTAAAVPDQTDEAQNQIEELLSRAARRGRREGPPAPVLAKPRAAAAARGQRSSARRGARA